jgi:protein O-mannosyl-transferase
VPGGFWFHRRVNADAASLKRARRRGISAARSRDDEDPVGATAFATVEGMPRPLEVFLGGRWFVLASLLGLIGLTVMLYRHTIPFPFVFDDWIYLVENPLVKEFPTFRFWTDAREFAAEPARLGLDPDLAVNIMLRPFAYATFYLNRIVGGDHPEGYRLVNIVTHAANGALVFLVLRHILLRSRLRLPERTLSAAFIPLAAALLFVAHPLQIESVTYVIQRFTSLAALFFLSALWLHLIASDVPGRDARAVIRGISVVMMILGMLTKEFVFMLPPVAILVDWIVMGTGFATAFRRAIPIVLCMAVVPSLVLFAAWAQGNGVVTLHAAMNIVNFDDAPRPHLRFFMNELRVILTYLRLILVPTGLNVDRDVRSIVNLADWRILGSGAGILAILASSWFIFRRGRGNLHAAMVFVFTAWFFLVIFVSSGLVPLPDLMAEHRTYLPSVGAIVVLVCGLDYLRTWPRAGRFRRRVIPAVAALWVCVLSGAAFLRHEAWKSRRALWEDTLAKSPGSIRAMVNLGTCHGEEGRPEAAAECFRQAIATEPRHSVATENLATIYIGQREYEKANQVCREGLSRGIDTFRIRHNLGLALCNTGRLDEGISELERSLMQNQTFCPTLVALGQASYQAKRPDRAIDFLRKAVALVPGNREVQKMVAQLEQELGARGRPGS